MERYERVFLILSGVFLASLIIANAIALKFFDIDLPLIGTITLSLGVLPYPITFLVTDLISELYGRKRADMVVFVGFLLSLFFLFFLAVGLAMPTSSFQANTTIAHSFKEIFGAGSRVILASMTAYLLAQFLDVRIFHLLKHWTKGRHLWLRNNGSTLISQLLDTVLVVSILFYDNPDANLPLLIGSSYIFKLLVALADTPVIYLCVHFLKDLEMETLRRSQVKIDSEWEPLP